MKITSLDWWLGRTDKQFARREYYKARRDDLRQEKAQRKASKRTRRGIPFIFFW